MLFPHHTPQPARGFTLIELLVVISILGILSSIVLASIVGARESAKVVQAGLTQHALSTAVELYYLDIGFYPPDLPRGWDPGFMHPLPYNPDTDTHAAVDSVACDHCGGPGWEAIVQARWRGPYMESWPQYTPWGGKYDYNYWPAGATRGPCTVPPGIYVGVQGDYTNDNTIPITAEEKMILRGFDAEACLNGESQMLLHSL